jgi:uncharacterized protein
MMGTNHRAFARPTTARRALAALAVTCALGAVGSASAQISTTGTTGYAKVSIATASQTGNYFATGTAICRALQRQGLYLPSGDVTLVDCAASPSGGSFQNIDLVRLRAVDLALVQSDWQLHAVKGSSAFAGRKIENLRALLSLNPEAFQVMAGRGTRIDAWPDLKAKKVNLGPVGSTGQSMFQELFSAHTVDAKWLTQGLNLPITAHVQELCEGNIEALGQTSGVPNSGLADAARRCGATLVRLDTAEIKRMVEDRPDLDTIVVPARSYAGQEADVPTFGVLATLVATSELPDHVAYSAVRAIFEALPELGAMVPVLRNLDPARMIKVGLSAPLHPGAVRYYRERGWITDRAKPTGSAAGPAVAERPAMPAMPIVTPTLAPAVAAPVVPTKARTKPKRSS